MFIITIFLITILIPTVQLARPTLKLTFTPDEKYMPHHQQIEIQCELFNPTQRTDSAQLWYVDLKTGKRTPISRTLLTSSTEDSPEVFKSNRNKRYEYIRKNHIRIRALQMEDSAKYECNCPDCEESIKREMRDLSVMRLVEPKWFIEGGWPLHENTKTTIKCQTEDFYPYVSHRIFRNQQEITNEGRSTLTNSNAFPQKFVWESTITPTADWHNSTLRCSVTEGSTEQQVTKTLEILFAARFLKCEERQYVDSKVDQSSIECSYSGNPQPKLNWHRQSDQAPLVSDGGFKIETKDEQNGKYKSIFTFDRNKLITIPSQENLSGENYYQQLLSKGFSVKLTVNGIEKATRNINIERDVKRMRSGSWNKSMKISCSTILLSFLLILQIIQR